MPGQDKAMCLANTYLLHTHTHTHSNPPATELAKRLKKIPFYTLHLHSHAYMHITFIVPALTHSRGHSERKEEEKAKVGCDWRVHCSDKTNLHTQRLRSEYA